MRLAPLSFREAAQFVSPLSGAKQSGQVGDLRPNLGSTTPPAREIGRIWQADSDRLRWRQSQATVPPFTRTGFTAARTDDRGVRRAFFPEFNSRRTSQGRSRHWLSCRSKTASTKGPARNHYRVRNSIRLNHPVDQDSIRSQKPLSPLLFQCSVRSAPGNLVGG